MNRRRQMFCVVMLALPAAGWATAAAPTTAAPAVPPASAPKQSVPNPLAPRFKQVRERIDGLFQHRIDAPSPVDPRFNPFRTPGTAAPAVATGLMPAGNGATSPAAPPPPPATNLMILQQAVATLKVSGVFEIGGKSHLVINARPYKEGDVVQTLVQGETIYLRVREISKRSVTLVLNDAEMTLRF